MDPNSDRIPMNLVGVMYGNVSGLIEAIVDAACNSHHAVRMREIADQLDGAAFRIRQAGRQRRNDPREQPIKSRPF